MLNVGSLKEGIVLDHIEAGKGMSIYSALNLDKLECSVAIIKNARSNKMKKKDIIPISIIKVSKTFLNQTLHLLEKHIRQFNRMYEE